MDLLNCIEKFYSPLPEAGLGTSLSSDLPPDLEFPINPTADWPQTLIGPEAMLIRSEGMLPFRNAAPANATRRLAAKCAVEFVA